MLTLIGQDVSYIDKLLTNSVTYCAYDFKAGQYAADSQPQSLDEALYLVRLYRHKYRIPHGKVKKDAFQHSSEAWPSESKQSAYDSQHGKLKKDVSQHSSELCHQSQSG